jgi:hypothetical protein
MLDDDVARDEVTVVVDNSFDVDVIWTTEELDDDVIVEEKAMFLLSPFSFSLNVDDSFLLNCLTLRFKNNGFLNDDSWKMIEYKNIISKQ